MLAGLDVPPSLILQVWAETLRNPELDAVLQRGIAGVLASWTTIAENHQRRGLMRADVPRSTWRARSSPVPRASSSSAP